MQLKIFVSQDNIKNGVPGSPVKCPIALALKESGYKDVYVDELDISLRKGEDIVLYSWSLSRPALLFIYRFDHNEPVYPTTFQLR